MKLPDFEQVVAMVAAANASAQVRIARLEKALVKKHLLTEADLDEAMSAQEMARLKEQETQALLQRYWEHVEAERAKTQTADTDERPN